MTASSTKKKSKERRREELAERDKQQQAINDQRAIKKTKDHREQVNETGRDGTGQDATRSTYTTLSTAARLE